MPEVKYNGIQVSDPTIRELLQRAADLSGENIKVVSGDRSTSYNSSIQGAAKNSLHTHNMAADFHFEKMSDAKGFAFFRDNAKEIFDHDKANQLLIHGSHTATEKSHLHIGHFNREKDQFKEKGVYFQTEGMTPSQTGKYTTHYVNLDGKEKGTQHKEVSKQESKEVISKSAPAQSNKEHVLER